MKAEELETTDVGAPELASYMATVIEQLRCEGKFPAVHVYRCALHSFQKFAGGSDIQLLMDEVFTPGRLKAYEEWLMVKQKRELNTVSGYMRILRAIYNRWTPPGTLGHDSKLFSNVYTKVVSQTKRALNEKQMERLLKADTYGLPEFLTKEQQAVLAYFLLMFMFRGMPFIDLAHLRKCDIRGRYIIYRRHKTGKQLTLEIPQAALRLIREYRDGNSDNAYLFPILNPDIHSSLEQYQRYRDALRRFNHTLKLIMKRLLPGIKISSYTARHTWATIAYHLGQPIGLISQSLGHSSVRVTETYFKPFENARIDKLNRQLIEVVKKGKWKNRVVYSVL